MTTPTNLEATLRTELTTAMKAKDQPTANLVRMINTKIMERRTAKDFKGTVDDALILDVISTYKKSMEKAKVDFANAGDRGKEQLAELEVRDRVVQQVLAAGRERGRAARRGREGGRRAAGQVIQKMAGKIIGAIKKQFGDRADGQLVKKLADEAARTPSARGSTPRRTAAQSDGVVAELRMPCRRRRRHRPTRSPCGDLDLRTRRRRARIAVPAATMPVVWFFVSSASVLRAVRSSAITPASASTWNSVT